MDININNVDIFSYNMKNNERYVGVKKHIKLRRAKGTTATVVEQSLKLQGLNLIF